MSWHGQTCILCRPTTFMNQSGQAVRAVADYYGIGPEFTVVAHDELDLPPGRVRLKRGGGHGGHNGLRSLFSHLDGQDFLRVRLGIGHPGVREAVTPWVLSRAPADDEKAITEGIGRAVEAMPKVVTGHPEAAMQALHSD